MVSFQGKEIVFLEIFLKRKLSFTVDCFQIPKWRQYAIQFVWISFAVLSKPFSINKTAKISHELSAVYTTYMYCICIQSIGWQVIWQSLYRFDRHTTFIWQSSSSSSSSRSSKKENKLVSTFTLSEGNSSDRILKSSCSAELGDLFQQR